MKDMRTREKDPKYRDMVKRNIEALGRLLGPNGPIFLIALRWYRDDRFRYEFPVSRLPVRFAVQTESKSSY